MYAPAVVVKGLVKHYGDVRAVDGISFTVGRGEVFSLLGPNGAGKTTTVEIIEGLRKADSGNVRVLGIDIRKRRREILKRIGVLPQDFSSFDNLTVIETVRYFQELFGGGTDAKELLKAVGLGGVEKRLYKELSGGQKRRLGIATALVSDPEIVFLDEPTTGLDPRGRREIWRVIERLKERSKTVFLTTHYMEEAEALSDRVAIMSRGKIIAMGSPGELIEKHEKGLKVTVKGGRGLEDVVKSLGLPVKREGEGLQIACSGMRDVFTLLRTLEESHTSFNTLQVRGATLEEVFLDLTGERLGGDES